MHQGQCGAESWTALLSRFVWATRGLGSSDVIDSGVGTVRSGGRVLPLGYSGPRQVFGADRIRYPVSILFGTYLNMSGFLTQDQYTGVVLRPTSEFLWLNGHICNPVTDHFGAAN